MYMHDFGLWIRATNWSNGQPIDDWFLPEEFSHDKMAKYRSVKVMYNGEPICSMRESSKKYFWIEKLSILKSQKDSNFAHLNAHHKNDPERLEALEEKIDRAVEDLQQIKSILKIMREK